MTITQRLKQAIDESGQTLYAIAKGSGVDQAIVQRFMSGERDVKLSTADKLAEYLGLELTGPRRKSK